MQMLVCVGMSVESRSLCVLADECEKDVREQADLLLFIPMIPIAAIFETTQ